MDMFNSTALFVGLYALPVLLVVAAGAQMLRLYVGNAIARRPDPHLGRKIALHTTASVAIGLLLVAASGTAVHTAEYAVPRPAAAATGWWDSTQRMMAGVALSGLLYLLICEAVLRYGTNDRQWPRVRRAAAGVRFGGCVGICMGLSTIGSCMAFSADGPDATVLAEGLGLAGVWFPVAVVHYWLMTGRDAGEEAVEPE